MCGRVCQGKGEGRMNCYPPSSGHRLLPVANLNISNTLKYTCTETNSNTVPHVLSDSYSLFDIHASHVPAKANNVLYANDVDARSIDDYRGVRDGNALLLDAPDEPFSSRPGRAWCSIDKRKFPPVINKMC